MQFLIYILVYPLLWLISILPFRLFYFFSDVVFFVLYYLVGYRKKVVWDNLTRAFPDKTKVEIKRIQKEFYRHMCDMFLEMIKTLSLSKDELKERYKITNIEVLQEIVKDKSVLIVCSHYANWEWNVSINNYVNAKGYAVYQKIGNSYFDDLIKKIRAKWNTTLITQQETVKTVYRNAQNGVISAYGMVSDQSPQVKRAQYWSEFMGVKVPIFIGPESMARKLDLAVVFLKVSKVRRGYYQAEFIPITTAGKQTKNHEITDQFLRLTEKQILERPEHYLWTHKRWKHRNKVPVKFQ
ncbi:lysophospholipid acyltransferase family protein [Arenibacter sp. F20364]|uniref:lysophospholipid acyltransferase family protein n=1 Tax=Arenibacter sp. F20364 TaxID=2926415 RepID=UPI001FF51CEA|nr:lysophospholipid acyltransferase family protein [Arenibacter sp. F20364]MCK0189329.1 lysophospholipid acyltransferase family protein [Arenibacter sp. F20364]